ncbi:MAG TPA: quinohemoprotein amine dehydrogenase subunit beta [Alphaproteobacteria bacterium]
MNRLLRAASIALLAGAGLAALAATGALAKEYVIAVNKPNNLHVIDADARKVVNSCTLPGRGSPVAIATSPVDPAVAFVETNGWGEVVGVNIDSCEVFFHAVLSQGTVRARSMAGVAVGLDGKELFVQVAETELLADRYQIRPMHRFLVYNTDAGLDAKPARSFDVPRGQTIMAPSHDGKTLWSYGHEVRQFDIATGKILQEIRLNSWEEDKPTYGDPDGLSFWPLYDNIDVMIFPYVAPVFASREARDAGDFDQLSDFVLGITTVDLRTNEWAQRDITSFDVLIFSMVTHPKKPSEIYAVYTTLSKYDLDTGKLVDRVDLDHTYYAAAISAEGDELYIGGTFNDVAIYSTDTLKQLAKVMLPGGDQGVAGIRVIQR